MPSIAGDASTRRLKAGGTHAAALAEIRDRLQGKYPAIWEAFATLGDRCHQAGPLDEKTRRLVKLGIAIAHRHEGAVHSAVRNALKSGVTVEEMFHAAILAVTTIGWPTAYAAMTWIDDAVGGSGDQPILAD